MPPETEREAYDALDRAITDLRKVIDPGLNKILGEWVVVAVEYDIDRPSEATYSRLARGGSLPYHTQIGLLETGLELTREAGAASGDD